MRIRGRALTPFLAGMVVLATVGYAERGDDSNRQSKNGKLEGLVDGVQVSVEYGRPAVRDRKILGGLVPWDQVWRTGADEATTISFERDVRIEGELLPAGRYALFTIPNMESWTIIFNNTPDQWGAFSYDESDDALRVTVEPKAIDHRETLEFSLDGSQVVVSWEAVAVAFRVEAVE